MKQRFQQLMDELDLTVGKMAEMLEIQPAVISHLKAGRNKPSFDLIQKILRRFPQINPDWLLLDSEQIFRDGYNSSSGNDKPHDDSFAVENSTSQESHISELIDDRPEISDSRPSSKIERVIVIYSDGSFHDYVKR